MNLLDNNSMIIYLMKVNKCPFNSVEFGYNSFNNFEEGYYKNQYNVLHYLDSGDSNQKHDEFFGLSY